MGYASQVSFFFISRIMDTLTLRGTLEGKTDEMNKGWMDKIY
jgi:hypothetical protein